MNRVKLQEVQFFKYLDMTLTKDGNCADNKSLRIIAAPTSMARLNKI